MKGLQIIFLLVIALAVLGRVILSLVFPPVLKDGQQVDFQTTLLSEPTVNANSTSVTVSYSNGWSAQPVKIILPPESNLHYGDKVHISGRVKAKVLDNAKTIISVSSSHFEANSEGKNVFLAASFFLRHKIQQIYENYFSQQFSSLLLGIVLGVRGNFSNNFLADLKSTGVMHVIAASGMNVTMVAGFFLGVFGDLLKRQWAIAVTICLLLFYCMVSGLQASIVRATIMIGVALFGQAIGRQYSGLYGLFLAASCMLLYNPTWLFDVGFQLSFAATCGIFFLKPLLPKWGIITDDIGTTIAAQIATLPILLGAFGSYGLVSILVNALVLWTIPPLMILGGIGGLVGIALEPLGRVFLFLCLPFLWFFTQIISFFGSFKLLIQIQQMPVVLILGYYLLLGSWVLFIKQKKDLQKYTMQS